MKTQQTMKFGAVRTGTFGLAGLAALFALAAPSKASGEDNSTPQYVLKTFEVPTTVPISPGIGTTAFGINNRGQIVGNYPQYASDGVTVQIHGFLFKQGKFSDLAIAGSPWTELIKINDKGVAVGDYLGSDENFSKGQDFIQRPDGTIHLLAPVVPGAFSIAESIGINNEGTIVGGFTVNPGLPGGGAQGFIFKEDDYTVFNYPGAAATSLTDINNADAIVGYWVDAKGNLNGFLRNKDGSLVPIEPSGATLVLPAGINDEGDVVGTYLDAASVQHGFILKDGVYSTLDFPNDGGQTSDNGINDEGVIVGTYGPGLNQGLIATPVRDSD